MEVELCWAYNRWVTEKVLPESDGRLYTMLCAAVRRSGRLAAHGRDVRRPQGRRRLHGDDRARTMAVHDNAYMKLYRAIEERGLSLAFHSGPNWGEHDRSRAATASSRRTRSASRWYNILHCTNWVINGMGERFPKLPVIWIEAGPRVDPVPDAAARPRIHAASVRMPAAQEEAVGLHARHVLLDAADGDPGHGGAGDARSA